MPRWMITCPQCNYEFSHSEIPATTIQQSLRDPFGIVPKPLLAPDGDKRSYPNCKNESVYHQFNLIYQK